MKHLGCIVGILALCSFTSCTTNDYEKRAWKTVESAINNQPELTRFLEYYKHSDDEEKYEAACFLISNMPGKHSKGNSIVYDIDVVKADSLISSLEESFLLREESSFLKEYSFEQFLEYILPYRIVDEPLEYYWKQDCKRYFRPANTIDIIQTAKDINSRVKLNLSLANYGELPQSYSSLIRNGYGKCDDRSALLVMALRASGIPCSYEFVPYWGSSNNGHSFVSVILPDGKIYPLPNTDEVTNDTYLSRKTPKIYRKVYSLQTIEGKTSDVPDLFLHNDIVDVTDLHRIGSRDVQVSVNKFKEIDANYLSVFSPAGWIPVASSASTTFSYVGTGTKSIDDGKKEAFDLGDGIVYLPVKWKNGESSPIGNPVIVSGRAVKELSADTIHCEKVVLKRKFPLNMRTVDFAKTMVMGRFEGANRSDFSDAEEIYRIKEIPESKMQKISINADKPFRYVRYLRPKGTFSIAEFSVYHSDGTSMPFHPTASEAIRQDSTMMNVFDGNPLTYYQVGGGVDMWVGVDLYKPVRIAALGFAPRNDDNAIVSTDTYELFYWNGNWESLGRKRPGADSLIYNNVPKNALLWLRDLTKGREERPFTYENSHQTWW